MVVSVGGNEEGRLDRRAKVELFEEIRREYQFGVGTIKGVARKLGVHRRQVRQALAAAMPPERRYRPRAKPSLGPVQSFIDDILHADRTAPRKQRHTAHRIHQRLLQERAANRVAESTVRQYVREQKRARGWFTPVTCVPQSYGWGQEAQVDWYEAEAELGGERTTQQVFCMRSMASGAAFHRAYPRATQQAFLDAHEWAFHYFGGVFATLRYDNLTSAVRKILRGFRREETVRFIAFRSHWQFQAEFCTPGEAHEKGGVEGEGGYFRRNHWVPVPQAATLEALNAQLLAGCHHDEARVIAGRTQPVGEALAIEHTHLRPLAAERFDLLEVTFPTVDGHGCVRVKTNAYSVPAAVGTEVEAKLGPAYVEVWCHGTPVAQHERSYGRFQSVLNLEHYLDVLERKPGALAGSTPLAQWRARGLWPASYDTLWSRLMTRHGKQAGTRAMIGILQLGRTYGAAAVQQTVDTALGLGCADDAAIRHLLMAERLERSTPDVFAIGALARYDRPLPELHEYDTLLAPAVSA
jgi:transposase